MNQLRWLVFGAAFAWCTALLLPDALWRRLSVRNYRGMFVSAGLGIPLALSSIFLGVVSLVGVAIGGGPPAATSVWLLVAATIVFLAGLTDDLARGGPRGLRSHLGALRRGQVTTGQLKLVAALAAGIVFVWGAGWDRSLVQEALGVVLIAAATNLWNGLDVSPGRAAKAFVIVLTPLAIIGRPGSMLLEMLGAVLVLGWFDLRERGMLGDAGANLLGFGAGVALYAYLGGWALWLAAGLGITLNLLAETVTLSGLIRSSPPLRWLDDLGRLPEELRPESSASA